MNTKMKKKMESVKGLDNLLVTILLCLFAHYGPRCRAAPAIVGAVRGWNLGDQMKYQLTTLVLSHESESEIGGGDVGYQLTGEITVYPVYQDILHRDTFLLRMEFTSPKLWIRSRKGPDPEGFIEHSSKLDEASTLPIYIHWRNGEIKRLFLGEDETVSSSNMKRGFASIFQYRTLDGDYREHDASGLCNVTYQTSLDSILKVKKYCDEMNLSFKHEHPNPILGVNVKSERHTKYQLNTALLPTQIDNFEYHEVRLKIKPEVGTTVTSRTTLRQISGRASKQAVTAGDIDDAMRHLQPGYKEIQIDLELEPNSCPDSGCQTLEKAIEDNRDALENSALGTAKSAAAFLKLIPVVREASKEELIKILKSPRYLKLRTQLLDVLGSAATPTTHQAAMKILRQDDRGDDTERYLWALSMSPLPHADIIKDILTRSEETIQNDQVSETLALTAAAMARQFGQSGTMEKARVSLELGLDTCTGDECRLRFLRALRNLRNKNSIPILLDYAMNGTRATSVIAWRALGSLDPKYITEEVIVAAKRTFYQIGGPKRDSSARTLAADIILETAPTVNHLRNFLEYLSTTDPMYEVRRYISQRLEQLSDKNKIFRDRLNEAIELEARKVRNYNVLAYKGLSTAFARPFLRSSSSNGTLVTIQEVNSGLLKRGIVDVVIETDVYKETLFSLGLFAGGLGSFVASSSDENADADDQEVATAGMEIDLLGVGIRPFVFFSGQGELMGHVWSGTASDRTPAFQAIANLHRHRELIPLSSGFIAELDVEGAMSFDLAGQIQLSLWSRNAKSLVEMGAGVAVRGGFTIRSDFVQNCGEFALTVEPKLELSTDVDFSGPVSLCMRLTQPETAVKHQVYKIERIPGSRHRLRKTKRFILPSPARSYLLNKKNNEMCSKVFG